jgi:hypothetical protein
MEDVTLSSTTDIHMLAKVIDQHISDHWEVVFQAHRDEMVARYEELGDAVYAIYSTQLFKPVHSAMKVAGLMAMPKLPGKLNDSREWGDDETDRQRWMWSRITRSDGQAIGTIVIIYYHDHETIRLPRRMGVIALEETSKGAVIQALSQRSPEFATAKDMKAEVADYFAWLAEQEAKTE